MVASPHEAYLALNLFMPQAIDRRTNAGFIVSGLWNSLGDVLGAGSFDDDKKDNRWSFFFGQDFKILTERINKRYTDSFERILRGEETAQVDTRRTVPP